MCAQSLYRELDTWKARNLHNINPEYWTDFLLPLVLCTVTCFFFTTFVFFIQTAGCKSVWFASGEMESPTIQAGAFQVSLSYALYSSMLHIL
jgi:hypothetical protein